MNRTTLGRTRTAAGAAALVLVLAACGDDTEVAAPDTSPAPAPVEDCPTVASEVDPPADATTDLAVKPVATPGPAPAPATAEELTYSDIVEGEGEEVVVGGNVELKYVGVLYETGAEFDASWTTSPEQTIPVRACYPGVIPGFSVGPIGMREGGRRQINIPAVLGYAEEGSPPAIPPNAPLIFIVDAVSVTPPGTEPPPAG